MLGVFFPMPCFSDRALPVFFSSLLAGNVPALDPALVQSLDERDLETRRIARGLGISYLRRDLQEPS